MTRCFLGFELTDTARDYLAEKVIPLHRHLSEKEGWPVRLVPTNNWHATLLFFPRLEATERNIVWQVVEDEVMAGTWRGLSFPWSGLSLWPTPRRPSLICLEAPETEESLQWPITDHLDREPFNKGETGHLKRYRPHITLMRLRRGRGGPKPRELAERWEGLGNLIPVLDPKAIELDRVSFFLSTLTREQPIYPREGTLPLDPSG